MTELDNFIEYNQKFGIVGIFSKGTKGSGVE